MEDDSKVQSDLGSRQRGHEQIAAQAEEEPQEPSPLKHNFAACKFQFDGPDVREKTISPDSCIGDEEAVQGDREHRGLKERLSDLEGLLKDKELSERDLSQLVSRLDQRLAEKCRKERLLLAHCARLREVLRQKEAVEVRLQERYSQVEELQQDWETSELEHEEQIQTLVGEIAEREAIQAQLEEAHADMMQRVEEMAHCKSMLEARIQQLESELAGTGSEAEEVGPPVGETETILGKISNDCEGTCEDIVLGEGESGLPDGGMPTIYQRNQEARTTERSQSPELPPVSDKKVARLENLLELREETVIELQGRLSSQEQLLREMQETQRRLSTRNEELGLRQRELSEEVHRWRARGSSLEQREREWRTEAAQLRDTVAQLEALSAGLETRLKAKTSELQVIEATKEREVSGLWADLRKLASDHLEKEATWCSERQGLEVQLKKRSRELEVSEEQQRKLRQTQEVLEEQLHRLRQTEGTLMQKNQALDTEVLRLSQLLTSTQDSLARERQTLSAAKAQITAREQSIKEQQDDETVLRSTIKHLQEDLERAQRETANRALEEPALVVADVTPELQVLSQRVKILEHSLRDNINTFTESEAALQNRIKELEVSERNLLVKVDDLTTRSKGPSPDTPRQRQVEKLHMLREEVRSMGQVKMKEEEMKRQSEYFEHYKQKLQQKLGLSKEREQGLQGRVLQLERELIDVTATAARLRTELERRVPEDEEEEDEESGSGNEERLKSFISSLQEDLRELLRREEAGLAERRGLREGLQDAEDNVEFLSHKLEDFRSRIHQLKLSESALLEEVEELAEENERLRVGLRTQIQPPNPNPPPNPTPTPPLAPICEVEPGQQELDTVDSTDLINDIVPSDEQVHLRLEAPLDPARNKAIQTPSITHCIQEAITVASSSCWDVVEIMQALRCGGVEQVQQILQQMESQSRLPVLEHKRSSLPAHREGAEESSQAETAQMSKHKETVLIQSQPDLLNLCAHKTQNTSLISLVTKTIDVDCNPADSSTNNKDCSVRTYSFGTFTPPRQGTNYLKETLLNLESQVESLRNEKEELESFLQDKEEALQRAFKEIAQLKMSHTGELSERLEMPVGERGDLQLETLKNNWRQENKVLGRRNEELLDQMAKLEGDYERELAQLRLQISLQERDMTRLEEENSQQDRIIAELQQKTEDDLNVVLELQEALREKNDQISFLQSKTEDDLNIILELQEALQGKGSKEEDGMSCNTATPELQETLQLKISLEESRGALSLLQAERADQLKLINRLEDEQRLNSQKEEELREDVARLSILASRLEGELREVQAERAGVEAQRHDLELKVERLGQTNSSLTCKVEEQQEALKIGSEMISDLQAQRDAGALEATRLQEALATSQHDLLALREVNDATITVRLQELGDVKEKLAHAQEERCQLLEGADGLRAENADLIGRIQNLSDKNKELTEKMATLENKKREESEREAKLLEDIDSLRREKEVLSNQIHELEAKKEQEANKVADFCTPKDGELKSAKDTIGVNNVVAHSTEQDSQGIPKVHKSPSQLMDISQDKTMTNAKQSPRHKTAPEIIQRSQATVFSYKTVSLGSTSQLETMATELKHCREELEKTKAEAQKWYRELGLAESRGEEAMKKACQAVNEAKRMRECVKEAEEMKRENDKLRGEIAEVKVRAADLERGQNDSVSQQSHQEAQLVFLQSQLSAKLAAEEELRAENVALKSQQGKLEDQSNTIRTLKELYDDIRHQAKLSCVVQKCQERNSLIVQMVRALRRYGCIDCALTQEAEDLVNDTALLEYSSTFSHAGSRTQDSCGNVWETKKINEEERSLQRFLSSRQDSISDADTSLSFRLCVAKADYRPSPNMPQTMLPTLPLSAGEAVQVTGVPDRRGLYHAEVKGEAGLVPASYLEEREDLHHQTLSSAGRSTGLSLRLTSPEKIINFHHQLQQSHFSNYQDDFPGLHEPPESVRHASLCQDRGEEEMAQDQARDQEQLQARGGGTGEPARRAVRDSAMVMRNTWAPRGQTSVCTPPDVSCSNPSDLSNLNSHSKDASPGFSNTLFSDSRSMRTKQEPPAAVGSLEVIKTVGQSSLMIGWDRPPLDELGCSNGTFVYGYRIYVDGEFHKSVMSSACTKAVLENLDLSVPVHISVQTLGANGLFAEKVHVIFKGSGFVAIYNYSPLKDSPNIHPSRELAFREGDTVWVFGMPRRDGFCEAEVNGRRGLAPVAFLEEIPMGPPNTKLQNVGLGLAPLGLTMLLIPTAVPQLLRPRMGGRPQYEGSESLGELSSDLKACQKNSTWM
ncbi:hypothetical protein JZ751_008634 [Albula glossodonta]|uniref:SH3 domain-containing protein n=1 Tax=Albula glossodonta TaxID=121402 RepID=A0A8T2P189_9TELE|nr:hypothetical protein JZ751_008634 [Albula glossodonta]